MDHVLGHVVRRGMDAHAEWRASSSGDDTPNVKISPYGIAVIGSTIVLSLISLNLVSKDVAFQNAVINMLPDRVHVLQAYSYPGDDRVSHCRPIRASSRQRS